MRLSEIAYNDSTGVEAWFPTMMSKCRTLGLGRGTALTSVGVRNLVQWDTLSALMGNLFQSVATMYWRWRLTLPPVNEYETFPSELDYRSTL